MAFGGLYTSISGLQVSKRSLDTVSHNISNANNPNYVRQSAIHATNPYKTTGTRGIEVGTGVNINEIRHIRDEFLDKQIRRELPSLGYHSGKAETLADVEGVFNEITNSGLQKVMEDFWNSWDELSKEPESLIIRGMVHESGVAFTDTVNHISSQLSYIQENLNKEIENKVGEVNYLLEEIGRMNSSIKLVEGSKSKVKANDFRDERNAMIDRLTGLIPVDTYENSFGESIVSLQGQDLVNGRDIRKIDLERDERGFGFICWEDSGERIELGENSKLGKRGQLAGYIDVRDIYVEEYGDRLDTLVGEMAGAINEAHEAGYGLGGPLDTGVKFFTGVEKDLDGNYTNAAANIQVNYELANLNKIAASESGEVGDGEVSKEIREIRNTLKILKYGETLDDDKNKLNIDEFYNDLVTSLALEREAARSRADNQGFLIKSMDEKRKGLSSVSLDEEMADMIKFQHAYSANSRVINTIDEMIDTIVNRLGVVGR